MNMKKTLLTILAVISLGLSSIGQTFITSAGDTSTIVFHLATDDAQTSVTVPITKLSVAGNTRKLYLGFDLNSAYTSSVSNMDFNTDNFRMSSDRDDFFWIYAMKTNLKDAFHYNKAE